MGQFNQFQPTQSRNYVRWFLTTLCHYKDDKRRPPPLSRLGTAMVRDQAVAEGKWT